jgi:hypothetical protein
VIVHPLLWPELGKLTVVRLLAQWLGDRLIDNHQLHDVAIRRAGLDDPAPPPLYEAVRAAPLRARLRSPGRHGRKQAAVETRSATIRPDRLQKPGAPERLDLDTSDLTDAVAAIEAHLRAARGWLAPADACHLELAP